MPNYFRFRSYLLYFYAGDGIEPIHVHVTQGRPSKSSIKFWLLKDGSCRVAYNRTDISAKEVKKIQKFIEINFDGFCKKWMQFFDLKDIDFHD